MKYYRPSEIEPGTLLGGRQVRGWKVSDRKGGCSVAGKRYSPISVEYETGATEAAMLVERL